VLRSSSFIFLITLACAPFPDARANDVPPAEVAAALRSAGIPLSAVAIQVQPLQSDPATKSPPRLALNATRALNPASTMKLVTSFAALELLGPTFTWKTQAFTNGLLSGALNEQVLEGDLILKGGGDPKLTIEHFWLLARGLRARGLKHIRGNLILDRGYFETAGHNPSRFDAEPLRPYNTGPDALLVNFKSVIFTFVPNIERGTAQVIAEPRPAQLDLAQTVRLADGPCNDWRARLKAEFQNTAASARVAFSGLYPASCGEKTWPVALLSHPNYIEGVFRDVWEGLGGTFSGSWRDGGTPPAARLMHVQESPSLAEVVRDVNKYSNNVMARQMFLTLSAETLKLPGSNERSAQTVKSWLAQRGLDVPELVLENGSGLSRIERISAGGLARVLDAAFASAVMPELMASLPVVAQDGTMRRRLKTDGVSGQAHIKTGSLSDVRAIAGYVLDRNGRRNVVVFIINHPNAVAGQAAQDALLRWVHAASGDTANGNALERPVRSGTSASRR